MPGRSSPFAVGPPPACAMGSVIPALTPHAVSVSLPKWQDNVDYEEGHERIKVAMTSGYPRFYIHHQIDRLAKITAARFGLPNELCILLPTRKTATGCRLFLASRSTPVPCRIVQFPIRSSSSSPSDSENGQGPSSATTTPTTTATSAPSLVAVTPVINIHACFFPADRFSVAKEYWQHTGDGISSRLAERCLILLGEFDSEFSEEGSSSTVVGMSNGTTKERSSSTGIGGRGGRYASKNRYYAPKPSSSSSSSTIVSGSSGAAMMSPSLSSSSLPVSPIITSATSIIAPSINASSSSSKLRYATAAASILTGSSSSTTTSNGGGSGEKEESQPSSMSNSIESLAGTTRSSSATNGVMVRNQDQDQEEDVLTRYVEERYGRNLDLSLAPLAKLAMRKRIAGVLKETPGHPVVVESLLSDAAKRNAKENLDIDHHHDEVDDGVVLSDRGVIGLTENDVWLYPCGMSAIFHAHQLLMAAKVEERLPVGKSVCFGFPYTDTLKILEKWGPGCHFLGHGLSTDLPRLRAICEEEEKAGVPLLAVFCEFPSNPLLRSPPLQELRALADEFHFSIVVDETIAGFINVEVLPLADVVVSSLTKVFSGDSNVMGGSLVINPKSPKYDNLKKVQTIEYEDAYFDEDAIFMERNSRNFQARVARENENAEMLCEILRSRRACEPFYIITDATTSNGLAETEKLARLHVNGVDDAHRDAPNTVANCTDAKTNPVKIRKNVVKEVYYPKFMTPEHYEARMRPRTRHNAVKTFDNNSNKNENENDGDDHHTSYSTGYGGLFSITFTSELASRTFFDSLPCYKGPSLGTNFTLACPYTILAHYTETEWAFGWGVEKDLVRVSVGLEDRELLKTWFLEALHQAEEAVFASSSTSSAS